MVSRKEQLEALNRMRRQQAESGLADRFWSKVDKGDGSGCWIWTASRTTTGYGQFGVGLKPNRVTRKAHRVAYELSVGPIPDGFVIDHLCRQPLCVRPDHLEPVTNRTNTLRGEAGIPQTKARLVRDRCKRGHLLTPDNTYVWRQYKRCRTCNAAAQRRYRRKNIGTADFRKAAAA